MTRQKLSVGIAAEIGGKLFAPSVLMGSNKTQRERSSGDTVVETQRVAAALFKRELCWKKAAFKTHQGEWSRCTQGEYACGNTTAKQG